MHTTAPKAIQSKRIFNPFMLTIAESPLGLAILCLQRESQQVTVCGALDILAVDSPQSDQNVWDPFGTLSLPSSRFLYGMHSRILAAALIFLTVKQHLLEPKSS